MGWLILIVLLWIGCGILEAGFMFAYLQKQYPLIAKIDYCEDKDFALSIILFGPFGLLVDVLDHVFRLHRTSPFAHGWMWPKKVRNNAIQ